MNNVAEDLDFFEAFNLHPVVFTLDVVTVMLMRSVVRNICQNYVDKAHCFWI